jgi:hypothetical protein
LQHSYFTNFATTGQPTSPSSQLNDQTSPKDDDPQLPGKMVENFAILMACFVGICVVLYAPILANDPLRGQRLSFQPHTSAGRWRRGKVWLIEMAMNDAQQQTFVP